MGKLEKSIDDRSQGSYLLFLVGSNNKYIPIAWQSKFIRRVVKSKQAAETLAMVDKSESCLFCWKLLELLHLKDKTENIKIICKMDDSCLSDSVHSSTEIWNKTSYWDGHFERNGQQKRNCRYFMDIKWCTNWRLFNKEKEYHYLKSLVLYQNTKSQLFDEFTFFIFLFQKTYNAHLKGGKNREALLIHMSWVS